MYYLIYLLAVSILLISGMTVHTSMVPAFSISINISNIINFFDIWALVVLLAACALSLALTRSWRPFLDAFRFMFGKRRYTAAQCSDCLLSLQVTMVTAFLSGGVLFLFQIINVLKSMDLSSSKASYLGADLGTGLLVLLYPLILGLFLLPVFVALRREQAREARVKSVRKSK